MGAKKKEVQKMSLGDFLSDPTLGGGNSWADEVEEFSGTIGTQALPPTDRPRTNNAWGNSDRGYATREREYGPQKIPERPPYTAHLGNLNYDATVDSITDFFAGCSIINVRIIEDREQQRPKGFAYAEFGTADGLKKALTLDGNSLEGRAMRIKIADPPKERDGGRAESRDLDWTARRGPLADPAPRPGRGPPDFGDRRPSRDMAAADDSRARDIDWQRRGPLSPIPSMERQPSRDGGRQRSNDLPRNDSFRNNRRQSPAWGEGRPQQSQQPQQSEGPRPPRREMADRPERVPSAAEKDMQWRSNMRPDPLHKSPIQSRDGSEPPPSPAASAAPAATPPASSAATPPATRPKLNLQKRTVSEVPNTDAAVAAAAAAATATATAAAAATVAATPGDSKASPFGAARPIDTAAREREIEEKRQQAVSEKRDADEKLKEERRLAKEAAAKEAAEKEAAEKAAAEKAAAEKAEADAAAAVAAAADAAAAAAAADAAGPAPTGDAAAVGAPAGTESTMVDSETPGATEVTEEVKEGDANSAAAVPGIEKPEYAEGNNVETATGNGSREAAPDPEQKSPGRTRDIQPKQTSRADTGNWRTATSETSRPPRGGPRGRGGGRGGYRNEHRGSKPNGSSANHHQQADAPESPKNKGPDKDGWTTVPPANKRKSQHGRAVA